MGYELKELRLVATTVLCNPQNNVIDNIKSYIEYVEKIIIVDNSIENNIELIEAIKNIFKEKVIYIHNKDNLGIAKALNIGCDIAIDLNYNFILTMDQDSCFENFEHYLKCIENLDNTENVAIYAAHTDLIKEIKKEVNQEYKEENIVITSGNIINLKYFNKIGRFDDKLFIDSVDFDFCLKAKINGFRILLFKTVYVKHSLGEGYWRTNFFTRRKKYSIEHNPQRHYYIARNSMYLSKKYGKLFPKEAGFLKTINKLYINGIIRILAYEDNKINKIKARFIGLYHYMINKFGKYDFK